MQPQGFGVTVSVGVGVACSGCDWPCVGDGPGVGASVRVGVGAFTSVIEIGEGIIESVVKPAGRETTFGATWYSPISLPVMSTTTLISSGFREFNRGTGPLSITLASVWVI